MLRAFTAIELLLVTVLSGILAVAAVALISLIPSSGGLNLSAAAKQVQSDIEYAQLLATTTGQVAGVLFVNNGAYTVYQGTVSTPASNPLTRDNMVVTLSQKYPGVRVSTNYTVEFSTTGAPTTGAGGTVTVTDGQSTKTIYVTQNTGRVTVQ